MLPATTVKVPLVLVVERSVPAPKLASTAAVLFAGLVSLVPTVAASVSVLVTVLADTWALTSAVTVIKHCAPAGALANVPEICVAPPTTAVAVVQVPPPIAPAVMFNTGVKAVGSVSVNVAEPVPPKLELAIVNTYCMVCPLPSETVVVTGVPQIPTHWALLAEKSVPTLNTAVAVVALEPEVVPSAPGAIVLV